jgi:hypothetical protein
MARRSMLAFDQFTADSVFSDGASGGHAATRPRSTLLGFAVALEPAAASVGMHAGEIAKGRGNRRCRCRWFVADREAASAVKIAPPPVNRPKIRCVSTLLAGYCAALNV